MDVRMLFCEALGPHISGGSALGTYVLQLVQLHGKYQTLPTLCRYLHVL